jgi:hypothetical protein
MSRVIVFGATVGGLAAASRDGGNGTWSKIARAEELPHELGSLGLPSGEIVGPTLVSVARLICTYTYGQTSAAKKENPLEMPLPRCAPSGENHWESVVQICGDRGIGGNRVDRNRKVL